MNCDNQNKFCNKYQQIQVVTYHKNVIFNYITMSIWFLLVYKAIKIFIFATFFYTIDQ